jgi:hypothetical protein
MNSERAFMYAWMTLLACTWIAGLASIPLVWWPMWKLVMMP